MILFEKKVYTWTDDPNFVYHAKTFVIGNKIHTHTWNKTLFDDSKKQRNESLQNHVFYDNHNDTDNLSSLQTIFLRIMIVPIFWEVYKINKFPISFGFCIISFNSIIFLDISLKVSWILCFVFISWMNFAWASVKMANRWLKLCHHEHKNRFRVLCRDSIPL